MQLILLVSRETGIVLLLVNVKMGAPQPKMYVSVGQWSMVLILEPILLTLIHTHEVQLELISNLVVQLGEDLISGSGMDKHCGMIVTTSL